MTIALAPSVPLPFPFVLPLCPQTLPQIEELLSRVVLYRNLFPSELEANKTLSPEQLKVVFATKFPKDIIEVPFSLK